mgnify:FL=1
MSKIEPLLTFNPNTIADGDRFYNFLYSPWDTYSLETINGRLDDENIKSSDTRIYDYPVIQKQSLSGARSVGGTSNLDYFGGGTGQETGQGHFRNAAVGTANRYIAIPGGSTEFYLPFKCWVLLTWSLTFTNDQAWDTNAVAANAYRDTSSDKWSQINLFVDGTKSGPSVADAAESTRIIFTQFGDSSDSSPFGDEPKLQDRYKARVWAGHCFVELDAGYHSASLRVVATGNVKQTRVRARSMKYIYFKHGAT